MLTKENIKFIYPATPMQEGMYFHFLFDKTSKAYCEQKSYRIRGNLDVAGVTDSMNALLARYDVLRTVFAHKVSERLLQVVLRERQVEVYYEDLSGRPDREAYVDAYKEKDKSRSFDLNKDVLMRVAVLQLSHQEYELLWSHHHIILDGWCAGILINEFYALYTSRLRGEPCQLTPTVPFRQYIQWLEKQDKARAVHYWQHYLAGYEGLTSLPQKFAPAPAADYRQQTLVLELDPARTRRLRELGARYQVTLTTILQTMWAVLLARYSGKGDVVFGKIVSGRPAEVEGIESMIGLFINTVPVRITCPEGIAFAQLCRQVHEDAIASVPYHYCQLAEIQAGNWTQGTGPLFDHIMVFENYPVVRRRRNGTDADGDAPFDIEQVYRFEQTSYDFSINVGFGKTISLDFIFNGNVYESSFLENVRGHFDRLIDQVLADPRISVDAAACLAEDEQHTLLADFNRTGFLPGGDLSIPALFEAQAAGTPLAPAVVCDGQLWTYDQINGQANQLAHHLRTVYGVQPGDRVGLAVDRSERMIIGLLGILKSGAAYVPVDTSYPAGRISCILADAAVRVLLTDSSLMFSLLDYYHGGLVALDIQLPVLEESPDNPAPASTPDDPAYVTYTSGSTGQPKGVVIPMRAITNYVRWANGYYFGNAGGYAFGLFTSLSFDLTLTSIFTTLLRGDAIHVYPGDDTAGTLRAVFSPATPVNTVKLTPSHVSLLGHLNLASTNVTCAILGGEMLTAAQVAVLQRLNPAMKIYNEYGPTETTVGCTAMAVGSPAEAALIGKPIANAVIYVLDEKARLQPCNVFGEIYIGGTGVGTGYHNNPVLTTQRFMPDPFRPGGRVYRSGDFGRWLPDGTLEFRGRMDNQVKIRGFRIELAEITGALLEEQGIRDAAVKVFGTGDDKHLVAYYLDGADLDPEALRLSLAGRLPAYMVPTLFVRLEAFPLTPNGKLDEAALPAPEVPGAGRAGEPAAPQTETERVLAQVYAEVFGREPIFRRDNFFALGGHSLKAIQVASLVAKKLGVDLSLRDFFANPVVEDLARLVDQLDRATHVRITPTEPQEAYEASHGQKVVWSRYHYGREKLAFNMRRIHLFDQLDVDVLTRVFATLIERHEGLRTTFVTVGATLMQRVHPPQARPFAPECLDLQGCPDLQPTLDRIIAERVQRPFDRERGPLFEVTVCSLGGGKGYLMLLTIDHIVSDAWSIDVLEKEALELYEAYARGGEVSLSPLGIQVKDYAAWHNRWLKSVEARRYLAYWREQLAGPLPVLQLPTDYPPVLLPGTSYREALRREMERHFVPLSRAEEESLYGAIAMVKPLTGGAYRVAIGPQIQQRLNDLALDTHTTLFAVLTTTVNLLVYQLTGQRDVIIGTPVSVRDHEDCKGLVGWFLDTLLLRNCVDDGATLTESIARTFENNVRALEHRTYPFEKILDELDIPFEAVGTVFIHLLNFNSFKSEPMSPSEWEPLHRSNGTPTFDLNFTFAEFSNGILLTCDYRTELFRPETIEGIVNAYLVLLADVTSQPHARLGQFSRDCGYRQVLHETVS